MSESLGQRVRRARLELGMSQHQLAAPDLSKSLISLIENDRLRPSLKTLQKISERLQKPLTYFFEVEGPLSAKDLRLLLEIGETELARGRFPRALEAFQSALDLARSLGDAQAEVRAMTGLGVAYRETGTLEKAEATLGEAHDLARAKGDSNALVRVLLELATLALRQAKPRQALGHLHAALRILEESRLPDPSLRTRTLMLRGIAYGQLGQFTEAITSFEEALKASAGSGDLARMGELYAEIGAAHRASGNLEEAIRYMQQARETFEALEDLKRVGVISRNLGMILMERGDPQGALPHLERSVRITEQIGQEHSRAYTLAELGRCRLALGDVVGARKACEEAKRFLPPGSDSAEQGRVELVMAQVVDAEGQVDQAIDHARNALGIFEKLGLTADLARARIELGRLLLKKGVPTEAAPLLWQAIEELGVLRKGLTGFPQEMGSPSGPSTTL
ncbi:MAG: tetratricopeptide repeat protein [Armatimonadota bacterium]|nr:tetratricopeptide repeat protein [Armatimonadota bacterium]